MVNCKTPRESDEKKLAQIVCLPRRINFSEEFSTAQQRKKAIAIAKLLHVMPIRSHCQLLDLCAWMALMHSAHIPMMFHYITSLRRPVLRSGLRPLLGGTRDSWGRWVEDGAARATSEWSQFTPGVLGWSQWAACGALRWSAPATLSWSHQEWH